MLESGTPKPTWTRRDKVVVLLLMLVFFLFAGRYYPDQIGRSLRETIGNIFWFSGFSAAITSILVKVLTRLEKARPSWPRIIKIFLALAVAFGSMEQIRGFLPIDLQGNPIMAMIKKLFYH